MKEECDEEIKQVCEEKIVYHHNHHQQPVYPPPPPPPAPTPEPIFVTTPHPYAGPIPQPRDVTITPRGAGHLDRSRNRRETNPESQAGPGPQLSMFNLMFKSGSAGGGGGGGGGSSLLNPSYLNQGSVGSSVVPLGSSQGERKRPAERESRFDKKESREER